MSVVLFVISVYLHHCGMINTATRSLTILLVLVIMLGQAKCMFFLYSMKGLAESILTHLTWNIVC